MPARLLLADDSITIQRVIELTFADEDVEVIAVGDGEAAIARLRADPPDIVLADIGMPGPDGYAVAEHITSTPALAHIPVLLLAGAFETVDEARVADCGSAGVLVKPFEPQMVISRVRSLLAERQAPASVAASAVDPRPAASVAAVPASPNSSSAPERQQAVDDYFERLDAAFATLNAQLDEAPSRQAAVSAAPAIGAPLPPPPVSTPPGASEPQPATGTPLSMADAFGALLGVEQGEPPPVLPDSWSPIVTDDLVDQVARRVAEQIGDRVVRELAPRVVTEIAERLVREEIAKIKAEAEAH